MADNHHPDWGWRRLNKALSVIVIGLSVYIFLLPVLPQVNWWWQHSAPVISHGNQKSVTAPAPVTAPIPKDNRLVIPALKLDEHLYEGQSIATVNLGVWIRPNASTPDRGSNTVLVGHRFTYANPQGVFYYLDKLNPGDEITIYWHSHGYTYQTQNRRVVTPDDTTVEAATADSQLTLYTCTPLWSLKERLVVVAKLERIT